jgi:hypothetical protein
MLFRTKSGLLLAALTAILLTALQAWALEPNKDGWYHTGTGVRVKTIAIVDVNVYEVRHFMKALPPAKSKQAVVDMDVDKKITLTMMRDVDADKIKGAFKDAYAMNGYGDQGKIGQMLGAFTGELKEKSTTTISYSAANKTTTITAAGGGSVSIPGPEFMKATWNIWFGKIDQPKLGDQMIKNL